MMRGISCDKGLRGSRGNGEEKSGCAMEGDETERKQVQLRELLIMAIAEVGWVCEILVTVR